MTNLIGRHFGQYKITGEIGGGGMGEVYLAQDTRLTRQVAVKILPLEAAQNRELVQRFRREASAAAQLDHPNIIDVYDMGVETGWYYIVMRHINGPTLSEILREEGALAPQRVLRITAQLTDALEYAHQRQIIHRDIKPANVMLERDDFVTLMDFGIAHAPSKEKLTMVGQVMGTAGYMSPEQASGRAVDYRTDIYALGVLIEEMLTGQMPGFGMPPSADLPPKVRDVVARSRAGRPDDRYGSVRVLYDDLRSAITNAPAPDQFRAQPLKLMLKDGREYALQSGVLRIGRAADNDVVLRDEKVSRHHAEIRTDRRGSVLVDLDSTNGTFLNGQRLTPHQPYPLGSGAWVQVGKNVIVKIEPGTVARPVEDELSTQTRERAVLQTASSKELPQIEAQPSSLQPPPPPPSETSKKKRGGRRWLLWIGGGIGLLCLLGLACFTLLLLVPDDLDLEPTRTPTSRAGAMEPTSTLRPTSTSLPDVDPTATSVPGAGDLILNETFSLSSVSAERWDLPDEDEYFYEMDNGELIAWHEDPDSFSWTASADAYEDFDLTMDVRILEGGEDAVFGMVFAMDEESDNYVGCLVQGDDSGYCMEKEDGELDFGDWMRVTVMHLAQGLNQVRVIRVEGDWAFYVNDECVGSGEGGGVAEGYLGLAASTYDLLVEIA
ncbi:MAG: protein kinase, partial [Chloroflexi bacterium]|nr:protein kinase [Chloroflexota bacterium]